MPVSKKRKKKRDNKPSGPPLSKNALVTKKRKISKRQIFIYVFSALIILSFALSFVVKSGGGRSSVAPTVSGQSGEILSTPVPGNNDTRAESTTESQGDTSTGSDSQN